MTPYLKTLLTPELLALVLETRIPFSKTEPIDFGRAIQRYSYQNWRLGAGGRASPRRTPGWRRRGCLGVVVKRIRQDVEDDVWTPLGSEGRSDALRYI
ncbi:hypothetical protein F4775DRAFT_321904 [Biscogniauxia sp. FL1348]|nr:hypothetical protein F4775DRAFT_321904 [Biscogniauxia sp. FL1348]